MRKMWSRTEVPMESSSGFVPLQDKMKPCIIVHGGAGLIPNPRKKSAQSSVTDAAKIGYRVLQEGGSALDSVEAATRSMENSGLLNAGCGSYLTEDGTVELDAMIMDGHTLNTGAVACVKNIANPISLARRVMTDTSHCLLVGEGAQKFARRINFPIVEDPKVLISEKAYESYMKTKLQSENLGDGTGQCPEQLHDTVGAVAIDRKGYIAVSSSTGGALFKMCGRVGDSPLVGSGTYANHWAGASCTGHGESLMKVLLSREVVYNIESGDNPTEACSKAIMKMCELTGGEGGVICVDRFGVTGLAFNTRQMSWSSIRDGVLKYGIDPGIEVVEEEGM